MAGVLVSYRRDDNQGIAARLADDLREILGADRVFRDVEIPPDSDFTDVLHRAIAASDALIIVVGRHWAAHSDEGHGSRLFDPADWVRTQIEAAFAQGKVVVPVLVHGAEMPGRDSLPKSIARLASYHPDALTEGDWQTGVAELVDHLVDLCPTLVAERVRGGHEETPADVLRELGDGFLDKVRLRRRPKVAPPSLPPTFGQRLMRGVLRASLVVLVLAIVAALGYMGARLFGGPELNEDLNSIESVVNQKFLR